MRHKKEGSVMAWMLGLVLGLLCWFGPLTAWAEGNVPPAAEMRFQHYTFALLWQPGVCKAWSDVGASCAHIGPRSRASREWSLHGLWASRPEVLVRQQVPDETWWKYGCNWFEPGRPPLPHDSCSALPALKLSPTTESRLREHMPMTNNCLDRHEFYKHEVCFGSSPDAYFTLALNLLDKVNASSFTAFVRDHRGEWVRRDALLRAFADAFHGHSDALELRCEQPDGARGGPRREGTVLTEAWITLRADKVADFPAPDSLMAGRKGNCARLIHILP